MRTKPPHDTNINSITIYSDMNIKGNDMWRKPNYLFGPLVEKEMDVL